MALKSYIVIKCINNCLCQPVSPSQLAPTFTFELFQAPLFGPFMPQCNMTHEAISASVASFAPKNNKYNIFASHIFTSEIISFQDVPGYYYCRTLSASVNIVRCSQYSDNSTSYISLCNSLLEPFSLHIAHNVELVIPFVKVIYHILGEKAQCFLQKDYLNSVIQQYMIYWIKPCKD